MEVRAKKALGQHFLTDLSIAQRIAESLDTQEPQVAPHIPVPTLEIGPGMGVLTQYLLQRPDLDMKMVEIDSESVNYLLAHFQQRTRVLYFSRNASSDIDSSERNRKFYRSC